MPFAVGVYFAMNMAKIESGDAFALEISQAFNVMTLQP